MIDTTVQTGTSYTWKDEYNAFKHYNNTSRWPQVYDMDIWNDPYHIADLITVASLTKVTVIGENFVNGEIEVKRVLENETQKIRKVIFSDPATIVLWEDGTKTVVKIQKGDRYDPEKGLAMACMRKMLSKKDYHEHLEEAQRVKNIPINEEERSNGV